MGCSIEAGWGPCACCVTCLVLIEVVCVSREGGLPWLGHVSRPSPRLLFAHLLCDSRGCCNPGMPVSSAPMTSVRAPLPCNRFATSGVANETALQPPVSALQLPVTALQLPVTALRPPVTALGPPVTALQPRGGGRARSLYATPPSPPPPPPPPPGFERWWAGDMAPTAPPFFPPGADGAPFSSVSARFRKTRRYTNVVCCPDMLTANVSPRTRGPWHGMLPPTM